MPISVPPIEAAELWNPTGVIAQKGSTYRFETETGARWKDWHKTCGPDGFFNVVDPFRLLLRVKKVQGRRARYFTLIGTIGKTLDHAFIIGRSCVYTAEADGEFFCFANDALNHYQNNHGSLSLTITRI